MNALVTVIVPTKNSSRTLEACLKSIKAQSYAPIEPIVIDNFSTDGTPEIAARYTDQVITKGPERSAQRNEGARRGTGEYLAVIDSDMRLEPGVIEACVRAMEAEPKAAGAIIPEESIGEGFWAECKRLERSFYVGVAWMEAARFFRRAEFLAAGGYDESLVSGEDWDASQRMAARGRIVRVTPRILHDEGRLTLSGTVRKKWYYASAFRRYIRKAPAAAAAKQAGPLARYALFFSDPKKLFARPVLGLGMLFMKSCEFGAGALGYVFASFRKTSS